MELLYTDRRVIVCLKHAGVSSADEPGGMPELLRGALGLGADDYIDKAKSPEELLARVAAVLRRASSARPRADVLSLGGVTVDFATMTASVDGISEELTKSEAHFLRLLASERGRCFSFDEIFAALRGEGYIGDDNAVRCIAKRLKAKLGRAGELISNARGVGYKLVK
jgi:DNA-binding response OmpR family regulator